LSQKLRGTNSSRSTIFTWFHPLFCY